MSSLLAKTGFMIVRHGLRKPKFLPSGFERLTELESMKAILDALKIDCIVDVGANIGQFGQDCRHIGYEGWIYSFEPSPKEFARLNAQLDSKWLASSVGLGAEEGHFELNIEQHSVMNSFLKPSGRNVSSVVEVPVRRLDNVLDEIKRATGASRLFLKCDTQGFDPQVIKGAGSRIDEFLGLMSEVSVRPLYEGMDNYLSTLGLYQSCGFNLHSLHPVTRASDRSVVEYNCLMVRRNS